MERPFPNNKNTIFKEIEGMKHYKTLFIKLFPIACIFLFVGIYFSVNPAKRDIDRIVRECYESGEKVICLSKYYPQDWDTLYYFGNYYSSWVDIEKRIRKELSSFDIGDRIILANDEKIVYYKQWFPIPDEYLSERRAIFHFYPGTKNIAIPREKAIFYIQESGEAFLVLYYIGDAVDDCMNVRGKDTIYY